MLEKKEIIQLLKKKTVEKVNELREQEEKMFSDRVNESSYEKDLDPEKKIVVTGVKGVKSTPFTKKFKNMAAYEKWSDSEEATDFEVNQVMNESDGEIKVGSIVSFTKYNLVLDKDENKTGTVIKIFPDGKVNVDTNSPMKTKSYPSTVQLKDLTLIK